MIIAQDLLKAALTLDGKDHEVRACQFVEGPQVIFINGVVAPLCGACGDPYTFNGLRFEREDLEALPTEQARELIIMAIMDHHNAERTEAPE